MKRVLQLLSLTMIGVFFALGVFLLFTPLLEEELPQPSRTVMIIILFIYGSFRAYRVIKKMREE